MPHSASLRPGFWPSPLTPEAMASQPGRVSDLQLQGARSYWLESRPAEGGRNALMCHDGATTFEALPGALNVRTRAQEYGGAPYVATPDCIYFVLDADQRIYKADLDATGRAQTPTPVSPSVSPSTNGANRYADLHWDAKRQLLWAVCESAANDAHPRASLITLNPATGALTERVSGADFYASPSVSPNGESLTFISWDHPDMPWQASSVWLASLTHEGAIANCQHIAGGRHDGENSRPVAVFGPKFSPKNELFFVDDRSNWWNIYRYNGRDIECVLAKACEFATPQWVFGMSTFDFVSPHTLIATYTQSGVWRLGIIDVAAGELHAIRTPFTQFEQIRAASGRVGFIGASPVHADAVYTCSVASGLLSNCAALTHATPALARDFISKPEAIEFPTQDGEWAHGFLYRPAHPKFALNGHLPPLLVMAHGGPTGACDTGFTSKIQFWTSRGFAVLDVNYRGSTGFGRRYRDRLQGNWGVTDVIDVCSGAEFLAKQGLVNREQMLIRGSSAGGFTVLAALTFADTFKLGASLYGIGDLAALVRDTHKFEAHYLDGLIAPYAENTEVYRARSPLFHTEKLNCPVIFLQGLQDQVVLPDQAEAMVQALNAKGIRTQYVSFADEGHGFRRAPNIAAAFSAELAFYQSEFARAFAQEE